MIVPQELKCHINVAYPQSNVIPFEEWLTQQRLPELERVFIPIHITSFHVNNSYGQDQKAIRLLQDFFDSLDRSKKYWMVFQYDDGLLIDTKDLDIVTFGMSYRLPEQKPTYVIPLIGQMFPYMPVCNVIDAKIVLNKSYIANFIGSITHPIREKLVNTLKREDGYYMSTEHHQPSDYHYIMSDSTFTLCPVGYGKTSFRTYESIHQKSIPIIIYEDEVMEPYGIDINEYGVKIHESSIELISEILESVSPWAIDNKRKRMNELYRDLCTYEGVYDYIIKTLQNEV